MENPGIPRTPDDPEAAEELADPEVEGFDVHRPVEGELDDDDGYVTEDDTPATGKQYPFEGPAEDESS